MAGGAADAGPSANGTATAVDANGGPNGPVTPPLEPGSSRDAAGFGARDSGTTAPAEHAPDAAAEVCPLPTSLLFSGHFSQLAVCLPPGWFASASMLPRCMSGSCEVRLVGYIAHWHGDPFAAGAIFRGRLPASAQSMC
jgi:hypothetical protein